MFVFYVYLQHVYICTLMIVPTMIKQIDKYKKHCHWRGVWPKCQKTTLGAWSLVTRPKSGGFGAIKLKVHNEAHLMKFLHIFLNRMDLPWVQLVWNNHYGQHKLSWLTIRVSFWWRGIVKLLDKFKGIATIRINDGRSTFLRHDIWNIWVLAKGGGRGGGSGAMAPANGNR